MQHRVRIPESFISGFVVIYGEASQDWVPLRRTVSVTKPLGMNQDEIQITDHPQIYQVPFTLDYAHLQ